MAHRAAKAKPIGKSPRLLVLILAAFLAAALSGCGTPQERAEKHFKRGNLYSQAEKYAEAIQEYRKCVEQDPTRADAYLQLARVYSQRNTPELAIEALDRVLNLQPDNRNAALMKAQVLLANQRYEEAGAQCDRLIEKFTDDPEPRVLKARVLQAQKDPLGAIEQLKSALLAHPESIEARLQLGRVYLQTEELELAEAEANKIISDLEERNVDAYLLLTQVAEKRGNLEQALRTIEKVVEIAPERVDSLFRLGMLYANAAEISKRKRDLPPFEQQAQKALEMAKRIEQVNPRQRLLAQYIKGRVLLLQERYQDAIIELQGLAATGVEDPMIYLDLARAQLAQGNPQMALQQLRSILAFDPVNAQARIMMAAVYLQQKKFESAIQTCKEILKDDPQNVGARHLLTAAYLASGDTEHAGEELSEVAKLSPESPFGLISQTLLALSEKRYGDAQELAHRIIDVQPEEPTGYNLLGVTLLEQQEWQPSVDNLRRAIELNPDFMAPRQNLARLYLNIRRPDLAVAQLRAALDRKPENIPIRLALAGLLAQAGGRNTEPAIREYDAILEIESENIPALLGKANLLARQGQHDQVEAIGKKILARDSGNAQTLLILADSHLRRGNLSAARETYGVFARLHPDQPQGHRGEAFCQLIQGDGDAAVRTIENARALLPGNFDLQFDHALALQIKGQYSAALPLAREAINRLDKPGGFNLLLANMLLAAGQRDEALQRIESDENRLTGFRSAYHQFAERIKDSNRPEWAARANFAQRLLQLTWIGEAESQARALTEEAPNAAFLWSLLGQVLVARGQVAEAQSCYEKVLQLEPEYIGVHQYLADLAWKFGNNLEGARDRLLQLLEAAPEPENPFFLPLYVQLGRAYDQLKQPEQAIDTYRKALSIDSTNYMALNNLAYLYIELGRLDEALTHAERARNLSPYNGAILDTLGWIYHLKGRHPEALEALQLAAALLPFEPTIQFHLGKSLMASGQEDFALRAFQRSLLLGRSFPEQEEARQLADRLEPTSGTATRPDEHGGAQEN